MQLTTSSILNVTVLSGIAVLILYFLLKSQRFINQLTFGVLFGCLAMLFIRMVLPVEYRFAITIPEKNILPIIRMDFLEIPIAAIGDYNIDMEHFLYIVWVVGIPIFSLKTIYEFITLRKLALNGQPIKDQNILDSLELALHKCKKKKKFQLICVKNIETPMIFGIRKPCIFLPDIVLSKEEWIYILKHEITHYYHGDLLIKYFLALFTIIYWWNPFAHILNRQVSKILELHTDNTIIQDLEEEERLDYAACLLHVSKQQLSKNKRNDFAISFIDSKNFSISQRFHFITANKSQKKKKYSSSFALIPMIAITLFSFCFIFEAYFIRTGDMSEDILTFTPENAYLIKTVDGTYDIYYNHERCGNSKTGKIGVDLPIYNSKDDVP